MITFFAAIFKRFKEFLYHKYSAVQASTLPSNQWVRQVVNAAGLAQGREAFDIWLTALLIMIILL